jgi:Zn-dependent peptidase ImmA (M78 family)
MILTAERIQEIKADAEQLLRESGYDNILPVPTEKIAQKLGYKTQGFFPNEITKDVSGIVDYASRTIAVNTSESPRRQHFTLAHELGHVRLHEGQTFVDYRSAIDAPSNDKEREANRFASELLMPSDLFYQYWIAFEGDLKRLASKFGVSEEAIRIRSAELKIR